MCRTARKRVQFKIITVVKFGLIKMLLKDIKLICNNYITEGRRRGHPDGQVVRSTRLKRSSGSSDSETKIG